MTTWYCCDLQRLPMCCGFYEAGQFDEYAQENKPTGHSYKETSTEALIERMLNVCEGRPLIFNFVKNAIVGVDDWGGEEPTGEFEHEYECEALRQAVRTHKNVIDLGTHINPGTNNKIHSYVIKDYK